MADDYKLVPEIDSTGNETGYYTREPDGISGMTVSALAEFCGLTQPAITQLLNKIQESDPITNDLSEPLNPFIGNDLRLITNDLQGRLIVPDEACFAIADHYANHARAYKGKSVCRQITMFHGLPKKMNQKNVFHRLPKTTKKS